MARLHNKKAMGSFSLPTAFYNFYNIKYVRAGSI